MTKTKQPINYLPLNILSRYELFLTASGQKSASTISIKADKENYHSKVQTFLKNNNIYYSIDKDDQTLYFVSRSKGHTVELQGIWNKNTEEAEIKKGLLLGYPEDAVKAFSKHAKSQDRAKYLTLCVNPYGGYMVRVGHENEDKKNSMKWRQFVVKDNPTLVEWLDKKINPHLKGLK